MDFDPVLLARLQFAFTIVFHIIFPSFTIGLSAYLATLGALWLRTGNDRYQQLMRFWTRIFAVSFAMGVVSGIVLSYQFGTNWSRFSLVVGNIVGPLIGYEVLSAFFLEATFLGVLLFGFNRVPPWLYVLSAAIVAVGTAISAFWILSANSWMQTPTGHQMIGGVAHPADWLAIVFNPSFPYRFAHMLNAAYLTTGFVVLAVGARYIVAGRHLEEGRTMLRMAIGLTAILAPLQLFLGDQHGLNTLQHQPIKIAAMEAHWDGSKPGDFHIFAWPDEVAGVNRFELSIPKAGSLVLTHRMNGLFPGLNSVPASDRPPVKTNIVRDTLVFAHNVSLLVDGLCRGHSGLGRNRKRAPAMDCARYFAHRRRHITRTEREYRGHVGFIRTVLRYRVLVWHLLHQSSDRAGATKVCDRDSPVFTEPDFRGARRRT
jgi:cytochrome d ubiquinol oxidase subunit I